MARPCGGGVPAVLAALLLQLAAPVPAMLLQRGDAGAQSSAAGVDLSPALDCLRLTSPSLELRYPDDAEEHVEEIYNAMKKWSTPVGGSFHVEDLWLQLFARKWFNRKAGTRLRDQFGPYIPIFAEFVKPWMANTKKRMSYPEGFMATLRGLLRKDVPYVAVSQNDLGISGHGGLNLTAEFPNILVLSAGGYGHAALPLVRTTGKSFELAYWSFHWNFDFQEKRRQIFSRKWFLSYVGSLKHAPHRMRERMQEVVDEFATDHNMTNEVLIRPPVPNKKEGPWQPAWKFVMVDSRFSLVPRGFGRTSYHLVEAIQMGLIPIHIYTDRPWIPFPKKYREFGFDTDLAGLRPLLERLRKMSPDEVAEREAKSAAFAKSHLTATGLVEQMRHFLAGPPGSSDLVCEKLPGTVNDQDH